MTNIPINGLVDHVRKIVYIDAESVIDIIGAFQKQIGANSGSALLSDIVLTIQNAKKEIEAGAQKK